MSQAERARWAAGLTRVAGTCHCRVGSGPLTHHTAIMSATLPVTVVTGFLGAGKTTLVNHWLARVPRGDVAVIVNEHGAVGIDGELLAARARVLIEVSGGCVCCTTQAELVRALGDIAASAIPPQRILIETSGAASPAGVLRALNACAQRHALALDGVVTVFDATRVEACLEHELALEQLGYADVVVLSRADACTPEALAQATDTLAAQNGAAVFALSARGEIVSPALARPSELLALRQLGLPAPRRMRLAQPAHVYESVSLTRDGELDGERFADFVEAELAQYSGRIFRIKGILAVTGLEVRMIVQGVADSVEITFGEPWGDAPRLSRLVVVGFGLDRDALREGFAACG
jgi:G3E family GTPase